MKKMRQLLQFREQMGGGARVHSDSGAPSPTFILTPAREKMSKWVSERATAYLYLYICSFIQQICHYVCASTILEARDSATSKTNKKITPTVSVRETDNKQDK